MNLNSNKQLLRSRRGTSPVKKVKNNPSTGVWIQSYQMCLLSDFELFTPSTSRSHDIRAAATLWISVNFGLQRGRHIRMEFSENKSCARDRETPLVAMTAIVGRSRSAVQKIVVSPNLRTPSITETNLRGRTSTWKKEERILSLSLEFSVIIWSKKASCVYLQPKSCARDRETPAVIDSFPPCRVLLLYNGFAKLVGSSWGLYYGN